MAEPTSLSPKEFKKKYGYIPTQDDSSNVSLTPQQFAKLYGYVPFGVGSDLIQAPPSYYDSPLDAAKRMAAGPINLLANVPTGLQATLDLMNPAANKLAGLFDPELEKELQARDEAGRETARRIRESAKRFTEETLGTRPGTPVNLENLAKEKTLGGKAYMLARGTAEAVPTTLSLLGLRLLNAPLALATMYLSETGDTEAALQDLEKEGVDISPEYRRLAPVTAGAFKTALEKFGLDNIEKIAKMPGAKGKILQIFSSFLSEGGTEGLQRVTDVIAQAGGKASKQDAAKAFQTFKEELQNAQPQIEEATIVGALSGGTIGGGVAVGSEIVSRRSRSRAQQEILESIAQRYGVDRFENLPQNTKEAIIAELQQAQKNAAEQKAETDQREQVAQQAFGKKFDDLTDEQKQKIVDKAAEAKTAEEDARIDETLQGVTEQAEPLEEISQKVYGKPYAELPPAQKLALRKRYQTLVDKAQAKKVDDAIAEKVGLKKPKAEKTEKVKAQPPVAEAAAIATTAAERTAPAAEPVAQKESIKVMITKADEKGLRDKGYSQEEIDNLTPQQAQEILSSPSQPTVAPSPVSARAGEEPQPSSIKPSRARLIGKGIGHESVKAVFPDDVHAELFSVGRDFKENEGSAARKKMSERRKAVALALGIAPEKVWSIAREYNKKIRAQAKAIKEGESFNAQPYTLSDALITSQQGEPQPSKAAVVEKPIAEIETDVDRFQNRATDFSEKTAATVAERFDPNLLDPIVLWKDPQNGKEYVLSGHSRIEGMKRRGAKNIPSRYFQGTEAEAMNFAKVEANRLGSAENLQETIKAYKQAKRGNATKSKLKDLFDGDVDFLESAQNLNESGDFIRYLGQGAATEFPYIKRFSRWVGELRKTHVDKLTDRHEQQVFDWLYKGEKRNREIEKYRFFDLIEKQVSRTDFNPNVPLQLKRGEAPKIGTRGRADTAKLEDELDQLRADKKNARTPAEAQAIEKEIERVESAIKTLVKTQPDLFGEAEARPAPKETITPTHKEFDRAFETFQEVAAKQTGNTVPEQSAAIAEELRARNVNPVIIDELTNPRRALKPRNPEADRSATSRPERIARAAKPSPTLKPKVDAVAQANVDFRNKESALLKAREEIKSDIEARGGEVVVDTDTGAMTITLKPGKAKISEADQDLIERLRKEAAEAGAYSLATVGQGFEVSVTPERIAEAKSLPQGDFKARALEFLKRNAEAKAAEKVFKQAKEDARNELVDHYLAERVAGKETPSALLGLAKDGTKVEIMARRVRSAAEPDLAVGGRDFPQEIAEAKKTAKERAIETGEPYIETRKASERQKSRAQLRGTLISARDIQNETEHESGSVVAEEPLVVRESESKYNARPVKVPPNKFTVDVPLISLDDFKGRKVFIFAADRMRVGEYTGLDKNSGIKIKLQGGPLFPFIKQNFGKSGWAFANKKAVNSVSNRIAASDGIGLVMIQGESGVKGNKTFLEILFAELEHGLKNKDYSQKDFLRLIDEARKKTIAFHKKQRVTSAFKARSESADLSSLLRQPKSLNEVKNMLASVTFSLRSKLIDFFASNANVKEYGIPDINLIIAEVNDPIFKGMEYGDIVSAIQFDKNPKIGTAKELGSQEHFSYGIQISGKGLGLFKTPYDVRDILKIEKPKPHAARSAFLRQPVQKVEKVKRGAFVAEQSEGYQPNRPGDFLTNPEAIFEQKPYEPNYKKRPDATPRTDRLAKEFMDELVNNRKRGRVYLANAIDASARETATINLIGQNVRTGDDLAVVAQVARNPKVEQLRYVLVKKGQTIGSYMVGSRLPSATAAFPYASTKEGIAWLNGLMKETGADGYYMLHNHPSGEVDTSGKEDLDVTETVSSGVEGFKGHVVIDSNVYATITRGKDGSLKKQVKKKFFGEDKLLKPSIDNPLIGRKAEDSNDLMAIGKAVQTPEGWATVVGTTPDHRIRGIAEVEEAILQAKGKRRAAIIRKFARDTGSADVFLVADQKFFVANNDTLKKAVELGFIRDAVSSNGESIVSQFPGLRKSNVFFGKEIEAGRLVKEGEKEEPAIVRESESTYGKAGLNREQFLDLGKMVNDFLQSKEQVAKLTKAEREEFALILDVLKDYKELSEKADLSPSEKTLLKYAIQDIQSPEGKRVIEKVQTALREQKPIEPSALDKVAEWTASMYLWRLASVGTSLGSNLFRQLLKYPELKLAAWFNQGVARQTRVERTRFSEEAERDFRDAWTGEEFKKAAQKAIDIMLEKPGAMDESKFFTREQIKARAIKGTKGKIIRAGLNAQAAIDVLFRQPATTAAIARHSFREAAKTSKNRVEQAKKANAIAQNVRRLKELKDAKKEVPEYLEKFEPILAKAEADAEAQTFQSELEGWQKHVSEFRRYPLARIFVPFFNTRMNVLNQAYARTPLSALGSEFRDLGAKFLKKSLTAEEAGRLSDRMAEITLGTTAFLLTTAALYGLSDDDEELITGDFDEKTIGDKPAGWLPNAARVGDTYVSMKGFEPYATIFTAFGNAASGKNSGIENAAEALAQAAFSNPMTNELFDIMESIKERKIFQFFVDMAAGAAIPGLFQDISKIADPVVRQKEGLEERFKSKVGIPGVSTGLLPRIDVFGEDLAPQTSGERALKAVTGVSISNSKEDAARREIRKLGLKHSLDAITHKGVSLEPWEVLYLNQSIGKQYHETVLKLLQNPTYLAADKEARKDKLRSVRRKLIDDQKKLLEKTPYFMARERVADAQKKARERVKEQLED